MSKTKLFIWNDRRWKLIDRNEPYDKENFFIVRVLYVRFKKWKISMSTEENINKIKKNYMKKISEIFGQYGKVNVVQEACNCEPFFYDTYVSFVYSEDAYKAFIANRKEKCSPDLISCLPIDTWKIEPRRKFTEQLKMMSERVKSVDYTESQYILRIEINPGTLLRLLRSLLYVCSYGLDGLDLHFKLGETIEYDEDDDISEKAEETDYSDDDDDENDDIGKVKRQKKTDQKGNNENEAKIEAKNEGASKAKSEADNEAANEAKNEDASEAMSEDMSEVNQECESKDDEEVELSDVESDSSVQTVIKRLTPHQSIEVQASESEEVKIADAEEQLTEEQKLQEKLLEPYYTKFDETEEFGCLTDDEFEQHVIELIGKKIGTRFKTLTIRKDFIFPKCLKLFEPAFDQITTLNIHTRYNGNLFFALPRLCPLLQSFQLDGDLWTGDFDHYQPVEWKTLTELYLCTRISDEEVNEKIRKFIELNPQITALQIEFDLEVETIATIGRSLKDLRTLAVVRSTFEGVNSLVDTVVGMSYLQGLKISVMEAEKTQLNILAKCAKRFSRMSKLMLVTIFLNCFPDTKKPEKFYRMEEFSLTHHYDCKCHRKERILTFGGRSVDVPFESNAMALVINTKNPKKSADKNLESDIKSALKKVNKFYPTIHDFIECDQGSNFVYSQVSSNYKSN